MAKIVFFCILAHGHTNPTLGVVRELIARKNEVYYYSYEMMRGNRALHEQKLKDGAIAIAQSFRDCGGACEAADFIELQCR